MSSSTSDRLVALSLRSNRVLQGDLRQWHDGVGSGSDDAQLRLLLDDKALQHLSCGIDLRFQARGLDLLRPKFVTLLKPPQFASKPRELGAARLTK